MRGLWACQARVDRPDGMLQEQGFCGDVPAESRDAQPLCVASPVVNLGDTPVVAGSRVSGRSSIADPRQGDEQRVDKGTLKQVRNQ